MLSRAWSLWILERGGWLLLIAVWIAFASLSNRFLTASNLLNIGVQCTSTAIMATGMSYVLLTAGVDLSVGAVLFVTAGVVGELVAINGSMPIMVFAMLGTGVLFGCINGILVTRFAIVPFIATLGTLYIGRGFGLWLTETRAMNLPESFLALGSAHWLWVPVPLWVLVIVVGLGQWVLVKTSFGRHVVAIGYNRESAAKAGIRVDRVRMMVYGLCGGLASLASLISLTQLGAISPTFGENREFAAIAASVLGGTSLFGGRGSIFPGAVVGAVLLQSVENGLVLVNADPYLYPMVLSGVIFLAVLLDSGRTAILLRTRIA